MDILTNYIKNSSAKITSKRESFKLFFDRNSCSERVIYKIEPSTDEVINDLMLKYTKDKKSIDFIKKRNNEINGNFGILFDEKSVRFYIDAPFILDEDCIFSIEIKDGISIKRIYELKRIIDLKSFSILQPIFKYLNSNFFMSRNDGQKYFRFRSNVKVPYNLLCQITTNKIMHEWIKKRCDLYEPVWIQISESSLTIYYKIE